MSATDPQVPPAAFSGMELDRAAVERKDPAVVAELLGDPSSRAVLAGRDGVVIGDGSLLRVELESDAEYEPDFCSVSRTGMPCSRSTSIR